MSLRGKTSMIVSLAVSVAALLLIPLYASTYYDNQPSDKQPQKSLRIGITSAYTKNKLSVPVLRASDRPFMSVIRIPTNESSVSSIRASGIKVVPSLTEKNLVKIEVSLLFGDMSNITSCDQYKKLRQQLVASYISRKGGAIRVSGLKKFGVEPIMIFLDDEIAVDGGEEQKVPPASCSGCTCGSLCCNPNSGQCLGCGNCGQCCRS